MANTNAPKGFSPVKYLNGSPYNGAANLYYIPSTDSTYAYYIGDAVATAGGADANGVPSVTKASGTAAVRGVIIGVVIAPSGPASLVGTTLDLTTQSIPQTKAKDYYVLVADDPNIIFEVQGDATATNQVAANVTKNANFTVAAPSFGPYSASVVASASINTTSTLPLKLFGLVQREGNAFGAYAAWLCTFNVHELGSVGTAGI